MKASLQARCARQAREIALLLEQNEVERTVAAVESQAASFFREMAEGAAAALKLIRERLNVPGHEHIFDGQTLCAICRKSEARVRRDDARRK